MNMKKDQLYEILRFAIVGGASFLVDYGLLYLCTEWLGIHYLYSAAISFTVSVIVNYWLCVRFVFTGAGKQTGRQAALFIGSSIVGLGNQPGLHVAVCGKIRAALHAGEDRGYFHCDVLELCDETQSGAGMRFL